MDVSNLVHMANRIGEFFEAMPDHEEALHGIAEHIQKFWEPRMRSALRESVRAGDADAQALRPLVKEALERYPDTAPALQ